MKNIYALFSFLFLVIWSLRAQPTCADPELVLEDDIENYASGDVTLQSPNWEAWPGGDAGGGIVTSDQASGGANSIRIDGTSGTTDALFLLGDQTSGHYILQWDMLVDSGRQAYFSLLHEFPSEASVNWGFDAYLTEGGIGRLELYDGSDDVAFSYTVGDWFTVRLLLDLDNDEARLLVGENTVDAWQFSTGSTDLLQMNSIEFWTADDSYLFYIDNLKLSEIPAPEEGQYCYTAVELTAPDFYQVPELSCYGAGYDLTGSAGAFAGYWFSYTPPEDGILSIASCGSGLDTDTRGWIFSGECHDLKTVGVNDDQCDRGDGKDYSSYREAVVTGGTTYYVMWDDVWEPTSFAFELGFNPGAVPEPGKFCQSAIAIVPGQYDVLEMTGNAAVAGPTINNTTTSATNYSQSEWYAFTPTVDGFITISSCELSGSDTHVFVYTGDCSSFEGLTLEGQDRSSCPQNTGSLLENLPVTAGTTYYIEWIDRWTDGAELFGWDLIFQEALAVSEAELDAGLSVFPNPAGEQLNVRYAFDETVEVLNVQLIDALGRGLRHSSLNGVQSGTLEMTLHNLPAGLYMLRVSADGAVVARPVVVR
ncbi:MAG: T9SS type A sorting domain-containing protein [Lewinellaceae bacterium]|nr:T9SS type A sorting domain-containing protein [Phaeodactylibacter sp.]MCB9040299.1 T9SS type A sorting domain-containing protein [Lewinellaceae bacterium]